MVKNHDRLWPSRDIATILAQIFVVVVIACGPLAARAQECTVDDKTKKDLCTSKVIKMEKGKVSCEVIQEIKYLPDWLEECRKYYDAKWPTNPPGLNESEIKRICKQKAEQYVRDRSLCDGETFCAALWYDDVSGGTHKLCDSRCPKQACQDNINDLMKRSKEWREQEGARVVPASNSSLGAPPSGSEAKNQDSNPIWQNIQSAYNKIFGDAFSDQIVPSASTLLGNVSDSAGANLSYEAQLLELAGLAPASDVNGSQIYTNTYTNADITSQYVSNLGYSADISQYYGEQIQGMDALQAPNSALYLRPGSTGWQSGNESTNIEDRTGESSHWYDGAISYIKYMGTSEFWRQQVCQKWNPWCAEW